MRSSSFLAKLKLWKKKKNPTDSLGKERTEKTNLQKDLGAICFSSILFTPVLFFLNFEKLSHLFLSYGIAFLAPSVFLPCCRWGHWLQEHYWSLPQLYCKMVVTYTLSSWRFHNVSMWTMHVAWREPVTLTKFLRTVFARII